MNKRILTEIWIYPLKSLGGIRLLSSHVMEKGLQYDRRWMLVDETNKFMTQRNHPKMSLFKPEIQSPSRTSFGTAFRVTHRHDSILLSINHTVTDAPIRAQVWDDPVDVFEVSEMHSQWFSSQLGIPCKLVSFPEANPRLVDAEYRIGNEQVSLADGFPLLIIGQSSLDDLNGRLKDPVPMNRFRPNLVFAGGEPYEEDRWGNFLVGENRFTGVKPCSRCVTTTVNQDTGEKGREPLLTLSKYRKEGENINFGQNVLAIDHDEIQQGDEITVQQGDR